MQVYLLFVWTCTLSFSLLTLLMQEPNNTTYGHWLECWIYCSSVKTLIARLSGVCLNMLCPFSLLTLLMQEHNCTTYGFDLNVEYIVSMWRRLLQVYLEFVWTWTFFYIFKHVALQEALSLLHSHWHCFD